MDVQNNHYQRLAVHYVYSMNVEGFESMLDDNTFDKALLETIPQAEGEYCPIYWISQCFDILIGDPDQWKDKVTAYNKKANNDKILRIFKERLNIPLNPIDFFHTYLINFREYHDATIEEVLLTNTDFFLKTKRPIDIDLFVSAQKFDFIHVTELLEQGANPDEDFSGSDKEDEEDIYTIMDRIGYECAFLSTEFVPIYDHKVLDNYTLCNIISYAAHESMWALLVKYSKERG